MLLFSIIAIALGVAFTVFGFLICYQGKYNLINGFEEQRKLGQKTDEYAQRVGHIEFIIGVVCMATGILLLFIRNRYGMEAWQVVGGTILFVLSMLLIVYTSFTSRQKGTIISNTYLLFSDEERRKMKVNKQKEYKVVTEVFGLMAVALFCLSLHFFTLFKIFFILGIAVLVLDAIWAIVSSVRKENSN